jgi:Fe(3+) dicitrate transport protein
VTRSCQYCLCAFRAYFLIKKISAEYTNMNYDIQQPGGLTDAQFDENPRQSVQS